MKITSKRRGSSLITTLLVLVVLSTIVVAFMQSMSVERLTARSSKNLYQAQLSAQAGVEEALSRLTILMTNYPYHAIGYTNIGNQTITTFVGAQSYDVTNTNDVATRLLVSSNSAVSMASLTNTNSFAINMKTPDTAGWMGSPVTNGVLAYRECRAPWIYLLQDPGLPHQADRAQPNYNPYVARYAYWIEDETSKIDFTVAGNRQGTSGAFQRTTVSIDPSDVDLGAAPLINNLPVATNNSTANDQLITFRNSVRELPRDGRAVGQSPGLSTNADQTSRYYLTMAGYANDLSGTGRRRANLNAIVTDTNSVPNVIAADLDDIIYVITGSHMFSGLDNTNHFGKFLNLAVTNGPMTNFGGRFYSGATAAHQAIYLKKIAANIRDYIDADSEPTVVDSTGNVIAGVRPTSAFTVQPQVIGKEAIPYFQEHAWFGFEESWSGAGSTRTGTIEIDHYLEFFNPSTKNFVAPQGTFIKLHNLPAWKAGSYPWIEPDEFELDISGVVFPAGQATVITTQPDVGQDPPGLIIDSTRLVRKIPSTGNLARRFEVRTTDEVISATRGFQFDSRDTTVTDYQSRMVFGGSNGIYDSHPFLAMSTGSALPFNFKGEVVNNRTRFVYTTSLRGNDEASRSGDPRSQVEQLTLGGYNIGGNDTTRFFGNIQGTGVIPGNATFTKAAMTAFVSPTSWPDYTVTLADTAATAYAVIRDGPMQSIGELGHIYDPRRVAGGAGIAYARGGGRTLKVGQPDDVIGAAVKFSPAWQNAAWRLADFFGADEDRSKDLLDAQSQGKININSVVRDDGVALKGLLRKYSFLPSPDSDPVTSGNLLSEAQATNLIASIKTYISTNGPFMERGELSQISFFNAGSAGGGNMATTVDRGREELFRRMVEMITTKSSAFSVFSVGQAIREESNGKITRLAEARSGRVYRFDPEMGNSLNDKASGYKPVLMYERP